MRDGSWMIQIWWRAVCICGYGGNVFIGLVTILRISVGCWKSWRIFIGSVRIFRREAGWTSVGTGVRIAGATERCRGKITCRRTVACVDWVWIWSWWWNEHRRGWSPGIAGRWKRTLCWSRWWKICASAATSWIFVEAFKELLFDNYSLHGEKCYNNTSRTWNLRWASARSRIYQAVGRLSRVQIKVRVENRVTLHHLRWIERSVWQLASPVSACGNSDQRIGKRF